MVDRFSIGPFSRVFFMFGRDGLHTYRYRMFNTETTGTLINTLPGMTYDGGPDFNAIYERTSN